MHTEAEVELSRVWNRALWATLLGALLATGATSWAQIWIVRERIDVQPRLGRFHPFNWNHINQLMIRSVLEAYAQQQDPQLTDHHLAIYQPVLIPPANGKPSQIEFTILSNFSLETTQWRMRNVDSWKLIFTSPTDKRTLEYPRAIHHFNWIPKRRSARASVSLSPDDRKDVLAFLLDHDPLGEFTTLKLEAIPPSNPENPAVDARQKFWSQLPVGGWLRSARSGFEKLWARRRLKTSRASAPKVPVMPWFTIEGNELDLFLGRNQRASICRRVLQLDFSARAPIRQ